MLKATVLEGWIQTNWSSHLFRIKLDTQGQGRQELANAEL